MRSYTMLNLNTTDLVYSRARNRGEWSMLRETLTGRSRCLLALKEVRQACHVSASQLAAEPRLVPIAQIVSSEGRCGDFDRDFNPRHDHNRERWLRIAAARRRGVPLPPVDLVQVGAYYFVRDGHHRISVARALGQLDIEASVTVWHVTGLLPWETQAGNGKPGPAGPSIQKTLVGRLYHEILTCIRIFWPDHGNWATRLGP